MSLLFGYNGINFTLSWRAITMFGKVANWKSTKQMSWLERCNQSQWLFEMSSVSASVSERSMAKITNSTSCSSSATQRCLCYIKNIYKNTYFIIIIIIIISTHSLLHLLYRISTSVVINALSTYQTFAVDYTGFKMFTF